MYDLKTIHENLLHIIHSCKETLKRIGHYIGTDSMI